MEKVLQENDNRIITTNREVRNYHQAKWDEPIIFDLHQKGERGINVPLAEKEIVDKVGDGISILPDSIKRKQKPSLPEIAQNRVLRHYLRLSQETLGAALNVEIGQGTCTMKYSPIVNEALVSSSNLTHLHPLQPEETTQGILKIMYELDLYLREISGMDYFTFQPGSGTQALFAMTSIVKAYHEANGEGDQRDEIITTLFSHPSQAATAAVKGFKVITLKPDKDGFPDIDALKEVVSERTAGFVVANPEDTGIFNPKIQEFTKIIHDVGGLCYYDQANANGLLGITRAREAGFDMCFFNLHKTFSTPHASGGPATGALGVTEQLKSYLPAPLVSSEEGEYKFNYDLKNSIGKVRSFHGVIPNVLRAYAWIRTLGAEGLKEVAKIAVLNNNYLYKKLSEVKGISVPFIKGKRLEQVRYSWEKLTKDTGITTDDVARRMADFAHQYWTSHPPHVVPEPFTLEPTESYSKSDIDEYVASLRFISSEAYKNPDKVKEAPHNSSIHQVKKDDYLKDPEKVMLTWRVYLEKSNDK